MISDNYCVYDMNKHRYVLTTTYALEIMNIELSEVLNTSGGVSDVANMPEIILERVSVMIYGYIYANSAYVNAKERELALIDRYRPHLIAAMAEQLTYLLNNGDVSAYSGVNAVSGMTIDAARMRFAEIAPLARDILEMREIISRRILSFKFDDEPSYEEDGY